MANTQRKESESGTAKRRPEKLARLPANAAVHKRPLLHPPLPSQYSNAHHPKVVYISTKTPFLSAVKRVEKLLRLSDKRLIQSATTLAKQNSGKRKRGGAPDEILEIAETLESKRKRRRVEDGGGGEEVVMKGTGKAIQKVMELGLWFQQREGYRVRLRTGSVGAVDDIVLQPSGKVVVGEDDHEDNHGADKNGGGIALDSMATDQNETPQVPHAEPKAAIKAGKDTEEIPETRIRYTSVLEVAVSLQ
ncbi:Rpp20 subunit of nuclear RNase MRP and P-domain-containing protein [Neohortaea acidophila]|uniref:Rpp20 subunit of nuclear RNase MRP and P-domain-containing protein n=1 Tax=Neohortaea acidophila TaxID=245834 RepID=A0A6A6PPY4_9PEZI|nr:Rpp20 subunit of nuclear RNase MRP and P-domain-containing protein [Neohortaea acidophila]KAF2482149.1 Rpp20 subunit of nuclear RNase MRP and P-domain-containing protein [Neohortaea acidophila]